MAFFSTNKASLAVTLLELLTSPQGAAGAQVFRGGQAPGTAAGLDGLTGVRAVAAGDVNNDGLPDVAVLTADGATLYINRAGTFSKSDVPLPPGRYAQAVWVDYDHDYDADLFLLGEKSALVRNNGRAGFSDQTADFPFVADWVAIALTLVM